MNPETFFENFDFLCEAPNGIEKLRELILQLAVMGKLVPQDPNDEPASVLLEKIKTEKIRSSNSKNIREFQSLFLDQREEEPFPNGWENSVLGDCIELVSGQHLGQDEQNYLELGLPYLTGPADFGPLHPTATRWTEKPKVTAKKNDVLITVKGAGVGKTNILNLNEAAIGRQLMAIRPICLDYKFVYVLILASYNKFQELSTGSTVPGIGREDILNFKFGLPPFAEQKRIVTKVDELMALCDKLEARRQKKQEIQSKLNSSALDRMLSAENQEEFEKHWQRICENFDLLYDNPENVEKLKQAVLQLAVQGKLVPQNPEDESASVLIENIKNERKKLIKEGEMREPKSSQPINPEELPFTLPEKWLWCKVEQIADVRIGSTPSRKESSYWGGNIQWVSSGEVANCRITATREHITEIGFENSSTKIYPKGTVLIAMIGQGKTRGQAAILDTEACTNQNVAGLIFNAGNIYPEYVWRWALSEYEKTRSEGRGGAQPALNGNKVRELLIPIPPLIEQKRIVEKVEQFMGLCDELEIKLRKSREDSEKLMETVVRGLLEGAAAEI